MTSNPYKAPDSELKDIESQEQRPVRGILAGLIVDLGGTIVGAILLTIIYQVMLASKGMSREQIEQILLNVAPFSLFGLVSLSWGLLMSFAGGYYCIKVSNGRDYTFPIILGVIGFVLGMMLGGGSMDTLVALTLSAVAFCITIIGARTALAKYSSASTHHS